MSYSSASLYVGDLAPDVTEAILYDTFSSVGPVASIRVCRHILSHASLGYGYVNFHQATDAERALDTLNFSLIKGKPCRIMWSNRDPAIRRSGKGNIFIKGLDPSIDNKSLYDTFSAFGTILSAKVGFNARGQSQGYGFVHFESDQAAADAISQLNGMLLNGRQVYVGEFVPRKKRPAPVGGEETGASLYVKGLNETVTEDSFRDLFEKFGPVSSCVLVRNPDTGVLRGFGFVNFEEPSSATAAMEALNETEFEGKQLQITRAQKKAEREMEMRKRAETRLSGQRRSPNTNVFVKNLEDTTTDDTLREQFAPFGSITSARVMVDQDGNSRGFGFVNYQTAAEAQEAINQMDGKELAGGKTLHVALAVRKQDAQRGGGRGGKRQQQDYNPGAVYYSQPGMPMGYGQPYGYYGQQSGPRWSQQPMQQATYAGGQASYVLQPVPSGRGRGRGGRGRGQGRGGRKGGPRQDDQPAHAEHEVEEGVDASALDLKTLAAASPEEQKTLIGNVLYPKVAQLEPILAGKITGMLLEIPMEDLLHLLESDSSLRQKVAEAMEVLRETQ